MRIADAVRIRPFLMLENGPDKRREHLKSEEVACNCLINSENRHQAGLEGMSLDGQGRMDPRKRWFVMRDLKRPNAKLPAYKLLGQEQIELFTPMKQRLTVRKGKKTCEEAPLIHDLLFVHSTPERLDPIVEKTPTLQYRYVRGGKYREAMTVADADMERFIYAVRNSESLRYYRPGELSPAMFGRKIRIIGGLLDHYEGRLLKGGRRKVLLVELPGLLSVGVEVSPEFIQLV